MNSSLNLIRLCGKISINLIFHTQQMLIITIIAMIVSYFYASGG
jgi:hypothetical protein